MLSTGWTIVVCTALAAPGADGDLSIEEHNHRLVITSGSRPVARYIFADEQIRRPYFTAVHAPSGEQVTRNHPPRPGSDATDHDTMHPGIWLAFGDLSGADFWRNKGRVELVEFTERPSVKEGVVRFAARFHYAIDDRVLAREVCKYSIRRNGDGWLITFDSEFSGERPIVFGDQEEMGLGIRLATPLTVKMRTGVITNSNGERDEKGVWGKTANWCDYSGKLANRDAGTADRRAGMIVMPHPENLRPSWMHARDYGLVVANPFGRRAFTGGEPSQVEVKPGERLRLRFAVFAYATDDAAFDPAQAYEAYLQAEPKRP